MLRRDVRRRMIRVSPIRAALSLTEFTEKGFTVLSFFSDDYALLAPSPTTRAWIEVDLAAIQKNLIAFRASLSSDCGIMSVVKANAYGHGATQVATAALEAGTEWLGVATVAEGATLRAAEIEAPIALLCPFAPQEAADVLLYSLTPMVGDFGTLEALASAKTAMGHPGFPEIHLEVDTGIGRSGILPEKAVALWREAERMGFAVTGLMQHYADADAPAEDPNRRQLELFFEVMDDLKAAGANLDLYHVAASASGLRALPLLSLVRPGLLLYGIRPPVPKQENQPFLTPVLTLKARVATVRDLPAGHTISYGFTHTLSRPSKVATLPIGYGDGFPRRLSNCGSALLNGKRAPILGRVCMDQTVVDVTDLPDVSPGDEAVLIGRQGNERISAEEIARILETTVHEITTCLTSRLPRVYV